MSRPPSHATPPYRRRSRLIAIASTLGLTPALVTFGVTGAPAAQAATLPAPYSASAVGDLVSLNADLATLNLAGAKVGHSMADVDSTRATKNSTAQSWNLDATLLSGLNLPVDKVSVAAPPSTSSASRTLLPVNLSPIANVGVISGQAQAAYEDATTCVPAVNGHAVLSQSRTTLAGLTLLSVPGVGSLGAVGASNETATTELVHRAGSNVADVQSTATTNVGDISLLAGQVTLHVDSPVVLRANSDGTTGSSGLINPPTITATIGNSVIPIPLNGKPITLPVPAKPLVDLKVTAFKPTDLSTGATGEADLQSLLRIQLKVLSVLPNASLADVDLMVAPMHVAATAPEGGVDCTKPDNSAPSTPVIDTPANGSSTSDKTPEVSGVADPHTTVTVTEAGAPVCTATTNDDGTWSCTPTTDLQDGEHTFDAVATNAASIDSPAAHTTFTVDTQAPDAPTITAPEDGSTVTTGTPEISGTAEKGSTVTVTEGTTTLCSTVADDSGAWSCSPTTELSDGDHTVSATATDAAGNVSAPATDSFTVSTGPVDTTPPDAPVITTPADGSTVHSDTPTVSGTAEPDSAVVVKEDTNVVCTATTGKDGKWSCVPTIPLSDGDHTFTATATDAAGNTSDPATTSFTVDTSDQGQPPAAPVVTSPKNGSTGNSGTAPIKGTADPGSTVTVSEGGNLLCSTITNQAGAWQCTPSSPLSPGQHTIDVTASKNGTTSPTTTVTFGVGTDTNPCHLVWVNHKTKLPANPSPECQAWLNQDPDHDGLKNGTEITIGTDPFNPDTDGDGIKDGQEVHGPSAKYPSCHTNPLAKDTDHDGLTDGQEVHGIVLKNKVRYAKHKTARIGTVRPNPCKADTDRDGLSDGKEVKGPIKRFPACHTSPVLKDTDHGGVPDGKEVKARSNPCDILSSPQNPLGHKKGSKNGSGKHARLEAPLG